MNLIGISGHAGSGKDTAADALVASGWAKVALADPMKRFVAEAFDWDQEVWGPSELRSLPDKRYPLPDGSGYLSPRRALQTLGTEWGRACYQDTWVRAALRAVEHLALGDFVYTGKSGLQRTARMIKTPPPGVVIPDVRFKNEVKAIWQAGGRVIRIKRPGRDGATGIVGHASEAEQDGIPDEDFDMVLINDVATPEQWAYRFANAVNTQPWRAERLTVAAQILAGIQAAGEHSARYAAGDALRIADELIAAVDSPKTVG